MTDYSELKRLAQVATPGLWRRGDDNEVQFSEDGDEFYECWQIAGPAAVSGSSPNAIADADYIAAANPAAVLALIAENEAMRLDAERYRWLRERQISLEGHDFLSTQEILDRRIDAAMAKEARS